MARDRSIRLHGVNVVLQPHSPMDYVDLLTKAYKLKMPVRYGENDRVMIGRIHPLDKAKPEDGLVGLFYYYSSIDAEAPWLNTNTGAVAEGDDLDELHIPDNLKPNLVEFDFIFYPRSHRLYFISKYYRNLPGSQGKSVTLPLNAVMRLLTTVLKDERIASKYEDVDIFPIPDKESLNKLLKLARISQLTLTIKRPNTDGGADEEQEFLERMNDIKSNKIEIKHTAIRGSSILPDEQLKKEAKIAAHNGNVAVKGYDANGIKVEDSTKEHPWSETVTYNPDLATQYDALIAETRTFPGVQ